MIVTCSNCNARFQLDTERVPAHSLALRCPKCAQIISSQPLTAASPNRSATAVGDSPATQRGRPERATPAPVFKAQASNATENLPAAQNEQNALMQFLAALMQQSEKFKSGNALAGAQHAWERRRALVCVTQERAERVAQMLADAGYEVYVAADTMQAITRMREDAIDVVVLEPEFDAAEQGAAYVSRAIGAMRPTERRRTFLVQISPSARTFDAHAAFVGNFNLVVNTEDLGEFTRVLERALREYNELYRDFKKAIEVK